MLSAKRAVNVLAAPGGTRGVGRGVDAKPAATPGLLC